MKLLFTTIMLAALDTGMAFAHALELIPKMSYSPAMYLTLHRTLYWGFGTIGGAIEVIVVPLTIAVAVTLRNKPAAFHRAVFAAACFLAAFVLWVTLINPVNVEMRQWAVDNPPAYWTELRARWEYTHLARFVLQFAGLGGLVLAAIRAQRRTSESRMGFAA